MNLTILLRPEKPMCWINPHSTRLVRSTHLVGAVVMLIDRFSTRIGECFPFTRSFPTRKADVLDQSALYAAGAKHSPGWSSSVRHTPEHPLKIGRAHV